MPADTETRMRALRLLLSAGNFDALLPEGDFGDDLFDEGLIEESAGEDGGYALTPAGEALVEFALADATEGWKASLLLLDPERASDEQWEDYLALGWAEPCPDDPESTVVSERGLAVAVLPLRD